MSSRRSGGSSSKSKGSKVNYELFFLNPYSRRNLNMADPVFKTSIKSTIKALNNHSVNTLTELCRIERIAASCEDEADARAFQEPMTTAWVYYVTSNQLLTELRGFTGNYPISADVVHDAHGRVRADPNSNRSWNLAWLCLMKVKEDGLIPAYAAVEASKPEMWGEVSPSEGQVQQLAACFEYEWNTAVDVMLRHWQTAPSWY